MVKKISFKEHNSCSLNGNFLLAFTFAFVAKHIFPCPLSMITSVYNQRLPIIYIWQLSSVMPRNLPSKLGKNQELRQLTFLSSGNFVHYWNVSLLKTSTEIVSKSLMFSFVLFLFSWIIPWKQQGHGLTRCLCTLKWKGH